MNRAAASLRRDALQIWRAGVAAAGSERLVRQALRIDGEALLLGGERWPRRAIGRIVVVGAGKAGAGMAAAVEELLGPQLMAEKNLAGWVNVPADCVRPLERIRLHAARPPGVNEPTTAGVAGTEQILRLVGALRPDDLGLCLLSGGGSALLPAPADGITLEHKLAVTRFLSAAGANIQQLNTVRKQLSRIKGGGLLRACRAGTLVTLIISDVLGDALDVIASGPTVEDTATPQDALRVLDAFEARRGGVPPAVFDYLHGKQQSLPPRPICRAVNRIIGNNAAAVEAAAAEARRSGYNTAAASAGTAEGPAEDIGRHLAKQALKMRDEPGANCLISGGEPVVTLVEESRRGLGGRNQQLVLAALLELSRHDATGIALLSGGTDGEDGPTDAAGALFDAEILAAARCCQPGPADYLARNDAYHFFEPLGALIKTGPTHTNVCDIRVVLVDRGADPATQSPGVS